ncbi:MAG: T9SS type A sorting domain-containing protein [Bacteroidetes bacterium]|nr:T9SS type A sorting domain-containing protein [Bacteroidota bacterium]
MKYNYAMAGWQQWHQGRWTLYYSLYSSVGSQWSPPALLTTDTLGQSDIRIQAIQPDSQFVVTWRSGSAIRYRKAPQEGNGMRDTIAILDNDSDSYDMISNGYTMVSILWTSAGPGAIGRAVMRRIKFGVKDSLYVTDTVRSSVSIERPRFIQSYTWERILFESPRSATLRDIYIDYAASPYIYPVLPFKVSTSSVSAYNARGYFSPVVTVQSDRSTVDAAPYNHLIAYQVSKTSENALHRDSSFIRVTTRLFSDSIQSNGFNRNPVVGSIGMYHPGPPSGLYIPVVWESNREGRTHIYTKMYFVDYVGEVGGGMAVPSSVVLYQNYPNPFNPATTIRYFIASAGPATLTVHDLLGRRIAVLEDRYHTPGYYQTEFSGTALSSGVYFYRLQAGTLINTKKMFLLK